MRTVLLHHKGAQLEQEVMPRWLASFSDLAGIVVVRGSAARALRRLRRELRRVGPARLLDIVSFRAYYRLFLSRRDREWETAFSEQLCAHYPDVPAHVPVIETDSPNSDATAQFLAELQPDIMIARCRTLIDERIFSIPANGTFVMHPGVAPEYRNSHGCFWALANRDLEHVGVTLLRIDAGVDTGPIYGYYSCDFDERRESHIVIQKRVVFENLDVLRAKLVEIHRGEAQPVDTSGRHSAAWGQPWLTRYLSWKSAARNGR
jgi:folate-dependent phosphoribosylglycinamide formyltransferase PurN